MVKNYARDLPKSYSIDAEAYPSGHQVQSWAHQVLTACEKLSLTPSQNWPHRGDKKNGEKSLSERDRVRERESIVQTQTML